MSRNTVVVIVLVVVGLLLFLRGAKILAVPIDCMPKPISPIEEKQPIGQAIIRTLFGTKCVSW